MTRPDLPSEPATLSPRPSNISHNERSPRPRIYTTHGTPPTVTVGAVVPPGRSRRVRPEQVGRAALVVVGHRAALQLGPVGVGLLAQRTHRVLQPPSRCRVNRPRRRDAPSRAVPINHIGRPGLELVARGATVGRPLAQRPPPALARPWRAGRGQQLAGVGQPLVQLDYQHARPDPGQLAEQVA
jgi:hypothetical protein